MIIPLLSSKLSAYMVRDIVQGKVVDNVDPLKKSRVKVSIQGISDHIQVDHLPWYPIIQTSGNSHIKIPPINTRVMVKYYDIYNSVVIGSISSTPPI